MRSIWISLILIPVAFSLSAQTSFFDSLEVILPDLPDSRKYAVYQRLRTALEGFEDREKRVVAAHQFRNYAGEQSDSILLRYALLTLRDLYKELDDAEKRQSFNRQLKKLASRLGGRMAEGFHETHPYYGYRYTLLYPELEILEDRGRFSFEQLNSLSADSLFALNYTSERSWSREKTHWIRFEVKGDPYEFGEYFFAVGHSAVKASPMPGWDSVEVYIHYPDGGIEEQLTGYNIDPRDQLYRDALQLFSVPLEAEERATVYLRLSGTFSETGSAGIFVQHIDPASLPELDGFRASSGFTATDQEEQYAFTPVERSLQIVEDPRGERSFISVKQDWEEQFRLNIPVGRAWEGVYWVKLPLLGDAEWSSSLLLEIPPESDWGRIDVYWPEDRPGYYAHRQLGQEVPVAMRLLPHWRSLIPFEVGAGDTTALYLRLEHYLGDPEAAILTLRSVDIVSFWPRRPYRAMFNGFFVGALVLGIIYFLFRGWLTWRGAPLYFALFLLGVLFCFAFWTPWDSGAMLAPGWRPYFPHLLTAGVFFFLFGLTGYTTLRLQSVDLYSWTKWGIPVFLGVWLLLNIGQGLLNESFFTARSGGPAWFSSLYWGWFLLGLLGIAVIARRAALRDSSPAYLILIAFSLVLICVVLIGAYWLVYRSLPVEDPVWRLSQAGLTLAVVFLALSVE